MIAPMSPDAPLRVAVVGFGLGGAAFHAPFIAAETGLRIAAIVTGNPERARDARTRYPGADVVPDTEALWRMAGALDVAVITTPNRTHVPLALAALDAGLHVVVDKPLAVTAADARRLVAAARKRHRVLTAYHNRRWDGDFLTLRRLIREGALGEVFRFESRFVRWRPEPTPGWRQEPSPAEGGGILYDLGPHLVDQALVLFGPVRHVHVEMDTRRPGTRVDDDAFLALTHESGVRSHLWANVISAGPAPRFRVLGSRASWTKYGMDVQEAKLRAGRSPDEPGFGDEPEERWGTLDDGVASRTTPTEPGAYTAFYEGVRRAIREGTPPPVDPADAVAVLEIIDAAHRAAGRRPPAE